MVRKEYVPTRSWRIRLRRWFHNHFGYGSAYK